MKILSFTGQSCWSKTAKRTCSWLLALSMVGGQFSSGQTTLKIAAAKDATPIETRQPAQTTSQVKQTTATTLQAAQNENEVYIFSFQPQKSVVGAPAAAVKQNVYQGSTLTAQFPPLPTTAMPAPNGDVYSILVRAGKEPGVTTPALPPVVSNTPVVKSAPITPITAAALPAPPVTSTVAMTSAPQPVRVALANPRPSAAMLSAAPSDMFSALANAGREAKAPPAVAVAKANPAPVAVPAAVVAAKPQPQPASTVVQHDDDQFRSVLTKSTREADETPLQPRVAEVQRPFELPAAVPAPVVAAQPSLPELRLPEPTLAERLYPEATPAPVIATPFESKMPIEQPKVVQLPPPTAPQRALPQPQPQVALVPAPMPQAVAQPVTAPQSSPVGNEYTFITPRPNDLPELAPLEQSIQLPVPATTFSLPLATNDRLAMMDTTPVVPPTPAQPAANGTTYVGSVTVNQGCGPLGQSCPYLPGQSGAQNICGVDCGANGAPCNATWNDSHCIPWSLFGPGEYVGPARPEHVSTYYLRVNDLVTLTFIASRHKNAQAYRIGVGDRLKLEWLRSAAGNEASLDREIMVQPDGTITLPLIGEVSASGKTVKDLQDELVKSYTKFQRDPQITVTPLEVNTVLDDILKAVTSQARSSGQAITLRVTPEGTIEAPGIGSVYVQGLTLEELRNELEARYVKTLGVALLVSPSLTERATSYVFMGGEVKAPGRYTLEGPTTVMQAIALAGGWNNGGNLRQVVIFRRDENWCLKATQINIRAPYYGNDPCPVNDVWLRDNDLVILPKSRILCATDVIELYFTRGIYAVFPITYVKDFSRGSSVVPVGP